MKLFPIYSQLMLKFIGRIPLKTLFIVPYMAIILLSVGTVTYLSYETGERAVNKLLIPVISSRIRQISDRLTTYLGTPQRLVAMNRYGIEQGQINPENLAELRQHFFQQLKLYKLPTNIYFGGSNGIHIFSAQDRVGLVAPKNSWLGGGVHPSHIGERHYYILNEQGKFTTIIPEQTKPYTPVTRPWYKTAQAKGQQTWSPVYPFFYIDTASISAVAPVYRNGELIGVVGCDLVLDDISLFLQKLHFSASGQSFIIERSGDVVATSTAERPFVKNLNGVELVRLKAENSSNKIIAATAKELRKRWNNLEVREPTTFKFVDENNQLHFAHIFPYEDEYGLDWLIVLVLPESDFLADIQANTYRSLGLGTITLLLAVTFGISLSYWVTQPILDLNQAAKHLVQRENYQADLKLNSILSRRDELGKLAQSFLQMAGEIQVAFSTLESAQRNSEEKFRKIFLTCPDAICIYDSVEQKIVDVNPSFVELSGYEKSELIGHHYQDLPLVNNQDDLMLVIEKVESLGYIRNLELHSLTKSGEVKNVLISCELLVLDGKQHVISFIKDISARQAAQAAFRESEARFRSAFEDAGIGMALVAIDGQFIRVNKSLCEMLGYNENDLLNQTFLAILHPEDLELSNSLLIKTLAGEISKFQIEKRYIHKEGNIIWGLLSVSLLRNIKQEPIYFVVQIQDISERHEVERVKNEFISVVSHEVRTPLTSIKGALGILETGVLDDQPLEKQQMLQIAINNSDRLLDLVNDILELESLTSRQTKLNPQWFDVTTVVKQAIEDLQPIATNAGISLKFNVPNIQIFADFRAILQTLTNLLGNAIKFSRPDGTVELSVSMSEEDILFTITDQGKGIPPEKLEAIFGRFQQVDVSDARQKGGTGLGLAICRGLVEEHQGQIWAESVLGSGSTFYFTIPKKYL